MSAAFMQHWTDRFGSIYEDTPLAEIPWFSAAPGLKIVQAVIDGLIVPGSRVVDFGCGAGCDTVFLARCGSEVIGVDVSEQALAKAQQFANWAGVRAAFVRASILESGLPTAWADVVNDSFVFHNVDEGARKQYASEIYRVLKPGGLFLLSAFSDRMTPGSGPKRIASRDIFGTFEPHRFDCQRLEIYRNLPTPARPDQYHWFGVFRTVADNPNDSASEVARHA